VEELTPKICDQTQFQENHFHLQPHIPPFPIISHTGAGYCVLGRDAPRTLLDRKTFTLLGGQILDCWFVLLAYLAYSQYLVDKYQYAKDVVLVIAENFPSFYKCWGI
jgi:hypothetical protein